MCLHKRKHIPYHTQTQTEQTSTSMAMPGHPVNGEQQEIRGLLKLFKMPTSSGARGVNTIQMSARDPKSQTKLASTCTNTPLCLCLLSHALYTLTHPVLTCGGITSVTQSPALPVPTDMDRFLFVLPCHKMHTHNWQLSLAPNKKLHKCILSTAIYFNCFLITINPFSGAQSGLVIVTVALQLLTPPALPGEVFQSCMG